MERAKSVGATSCILRGEEAYPHSCDLTVSRVLLRDNVGAWYRASAATILIFDCGFFPSSGRQLQLFRYEIFSVLMYMLLDNAAVDKSMKRFSLNLEDSAPPVNDEGK